MDLEMFPIAEMDALFGARYIGVHQPPAGVEHRDLHQRGVFAKSLFERNRIREMPRIRVPLHPQALEEQIGGPRVHREVLGDDAGQVVSLLSRGVQRGFAFAHELIRDGAPDRQHDDGNRRYHLDAELTDGCQVHGHGRPIPPVRE